MQGVNAVNSGICLEWQEHTGIFHCADKQFNETFGCDNLGYITLDLQPEPAHFTRKQYHFLNTDSAILFASPKDLISSKIHFKSFHSHNFPFSALQKPISTLVR